MEKLEKQSWRNWKNSHGKIVKTVLGKLEKQFWKKQSRKNLKNCHGKIGKTVLEKFEKQSWRN